MANQTNEAPKVAAVDTADDEWVTVAYKKPRPPPQSWVSGFTWNVPNKGYGYYGDINEWVATISLPEDIIARIVAGDYNGDKPKRGNSQGGDRRRQNRQPHKSIEDEIQGPLPAWYKPPSWDVKPKRRRQKKAKQ
ncbi:hypothetical protein FHL15_006167 [Xylaria flabelliformis]|uniref:Uncharacterized protein n=1 Tax=Xylaria flabelliformis TaxID=2512241 RepID=A0A553HYK3_9PEZI|nr:hypothetical protein FHL15_006167 [Xylaria flabelliformis]